MAIDADEVRLAPFGNVYVAPLATTLPTNASMALNVAFVSLGYVNTDGVSMAPNVQLTDIMAWQSAVPVKTTVDTISLEITCTFLQTNPDVWEVFFFNESFTNNFSEAAMEISSNPPSQEKALVIEWQDDEEDQNRLVIPRVVIANREPLNLVRNAATQAGVTFRALDSSGVLAYLYSENVDLAPST